MKKSLVQNIALIFLFIISGCVGTVQQATPPDSLKQSLPQTTFSFPGILSAKAVSHNKVELEFIPMGSNDYTYYLYTNNSPTPVSIDAKAILSLVNGRSLYTVTGLNTNQEYKFKITAENKRTASFSNGENEVYVKTFDNVVADFVGISKVALVAGNTDGAVMVNWVAPTMSGIFTSGPYDPVYYEVSMISDIGGISNLNNPTYSGTDKKVILVPTPPMRASPLSNPTGTVVDGLTANTRYFVQVRAINALYRDLFEDPDVTSIPVSKELNNRYLTIRTDPGGALFDFRQDNVVLANASGMDAFDKIDVFWQPGSGSFSSYRIFIRKYDGSGDSKTDDKLTESEMVSMTSGGNYITVASSTTNRRISGLDSTAYYQVKVALCKTVTCPVAAADPDAAIISDLEAIQVKPTLAPFGGINLINSPSSYASKDEVNLRFDAPLMNSGYANAMEFYCVNPDNFSQQVKFDGATPLNGTGIALCEGLYLTGATPSIETYVSQKIKGLAYTNGTKKYCFSATPAILGLGAEVRLDTANRIVRCAYPEVIPPTVAQFPGLSGTCGVGGVSATVSWPTPTGGVYSGFQVFWREKAGSAKFSFSDAIANTAGYSSSAILPLGTTSYVAAGLIPGKIYQVGVLAHVDLSPSPNLYSEYNLKIQECNIPLPIASFKGFTRIFALGPKIDGRIPQNIADPIVDEAKIYEALDANGIPYEVAMNSVTAPDMTLNYVAPPGRDYGAAFSAQFDGAGEKNNNYAMSRDGIISLAWEEVEMNFPEAGTMFAANQPAAPASRTSRTYGYRVYRSSDNRLTWQDMTATNGLIYSMPFSYRVRTNSAVVNAKMAFFTDYSVKALNEAYDSVNGRDVERARTYYYRIVPVFNGQALNYTAGNHHIVQVTLPPANMALVHRWVANRSRCLEIGKTPRIGDHYSCSYNGIGSFPKSIPYKVGETALDQGGDLLIDRFELGCRYTRGDKEDNTNEGASFFDKAGAKRTPTDYNSFPLFRGFRTIGTADDEGTPFKGCLGTNSLNNKDIPYPSGFSATYQHFLQGDCMGSHGERIVYNTCTSLQWTNGYYQGFRITTPGVEVRSSIPDCSNNTASDPTTVSTKLMGSHGSNFIMQSEFLGVFYNTYAEGLSSDAKAAYIEGPATGSLSSSAVISSNSPATGINTSQCSINLASIDPNGYYRPRWISLNEMASGITKFKGTTGTLFNKTVAEVSEVRASTTEPLTFYNGVSTDPSTHSYRLPSANLRSSPRYRSTTRLGKIMTSNAAKLPPIGRIQTEVARGLCNNSYVQVGIASDNGNFSASDQPTQKRLVRRQEHVTAASWPDHYDTAKVNSLENSGTAGSCNSLAKGVQGNALSKGNLIRNNSPYWTTGVLGTPLVSGSSPYNRLATNAESVHSSNCTSKYGIQDLIGNQMEVNSEILFCDYSQDRAYIGQVTGSWGGGTSAVNENLNSLNIPFFNDSTQREYYALLKRGRLSTDPVESSFKITFRDGSPAWDENHPNGSPKPWVANTSDSGYCSVVDNDFRRRSGATNIFLDALNNWIPVFLTNGAANPSIITQIQPDQRSVETWRNGDGRFLDFGPQSLAAPMDTSNKLILGTYNSTDPVSKYFNPIIGFPLTCSGTSCNDPVITPGTNDNTKISTTILNNNRDIVLDEAPTIGDFPIGNSQILNPGISEFQFPALGYETETVPMAGGGNSRITNMVVAIEVDEPTTLLSPSLQVKNFPSDFVPGETIDYYKIYWNVERGAYFSISSGGRSVNANTGRFTASINRSSYSGHGTSDTLSGARCVVKINEDR